MSFTAWTPIAGLAVLIIALASAEVLSRQRWKHENRPETGVGPGNGDRDPRLKSHQERPRSDSTPNPKAGNAPGATKPPSTSAVYRLKLKETQ